MQRFNIHGLFVVYFVGVKVGFQGDALNPIPVGLL